MRLVVLLSMSAVAMVALSGCGSEVRETRSSQADLATSDALESAAPSQASVTAAPGVAFTYRYAFRLPAQDVAAMQEQHAAACEKLGINRCRITGMRYQLLDEQRIDAMLSFKLDPTIARHFGKAGADAVAAADGTLIDSEISGSDAGEAIKTAGRNIASLTEELRRIEEQLSARGLAAAERDRLQAEAQQLRQSIRANRDERTERQESLATTPMTFTYASEANAPSIREAGRDAARNFMAGITILIVAFVTLLPWLGLGALLWIAVRLIKPRWPVTRRDAATPSEAS